MYQFFFVSLYLCFYQTTYVCMYVCIHLSIYTLVRVYFHLYTYMFLIATSQFVVSFFLKQNRILLCMHYMHRSQNRASRMACYSSYKLNFLLLCLVENWFSALEQVSSIKRIKQQTDSTVCHNTQKASSGKVMNWKVKSYTFRGNTPTSKFKASVTGLLKLTSTIFFSVAYIYLWLLQIAKKTQLRPFWPYSTNNTSIVYGRLFLHKQ